MSKYHEEAYQWIEKIPRSSRRTGIYQQEYKPAGRGERATWAPIRARIHILGVLSYLSDCPIIG